MQVSSKDRETENDRQGREPDSLGARPSGQLTEKHRTVGWKVFFFDPPAIQGSPIEEVGVVVLGNGHVLRSLTAENPQSHPGSNPAVRGPTNQVPAHRTLTEVHIVHNKYRSIRSANDQGDRLRRVNEVIPYGV